MAEFIVDPNTVSFEQAKTQITTYLQSKPDFTVWSNFFDSAAGQTLIELSAGLLVFGQYNTIVGRREAYQEHAENQSSVRSISNAQGYNALRGRQPIIELAFTPTITKTYNKYDDVGAYKDFNLIVIEDKLVTSGVATTLQVAIGLVTEEVQSAQNADLVMFQFVNSDVSDDVSILIDSVDTAFTTNLLDLQDDSWVLLTNGYGAVNAYYLNRVAPFYGTGTEIKIMYIALSELNSIVLGDILFDDSESFTPTTISNFQEPESNDSIKVNGPLFYESQFVIRGRKDYEKALKSLSPRFLDTSSQDFSTAVVEITYLTEEYTTLTVAELAVVDAELSGKARPLGIPTPIIKVSFRTVLELDVVVSLLGTDTDDFTTLATNAVADITEKLQPTVDLHLIENSIESNSSVEKVVRVSPGYSTWVASTVYQRLNHVAPTGGVVENLIFYMEKELFTSSGTTPVPNQVIGDEFTDGDIVWEVYRDERCDVSDWAATTVYDFNSIVTIPGEDAGYFLKFKRPVKASDAGEPTFPTTNKEVVIDGGLVWMCADIIGAPAAWVATTEYNVGDQIQPTVANGKMYQVVQFTAVSSGSEPTWPTTENGIVVDGKIQWRAKKVDTPLISTLWNEFIIVENTVSVS